MGSMASDPPTLGTRIRRARERARLSQEDLAKAVGASVRAVGDWENDRRRPRNRLSVLEDVLGVSLDAGPPEPEALAAIRREFPSVHAAIRREFPGDPATQERVAEAIAREMRGEPQPPPTSPAAADPERHQQAG
jgi:transcriptional regulator with XRE-family HTH domain